MATIVTGGRVCKSFIINVDGAKYFCKQLNQGKEIFDCEIKSLNLLHSIGVRVPRFIKVESNGANESKLILEYIDFESNKDQYYSHLGSTLAKVHNVMGRKFGMQYDTFLGCFRFPHIESNDWITFFKDHRWKPMFDKFLDTEPDRLSEWVIGMKIYDTMVEFFHQNHPKEIIPSLLHGDMNPGNWGIEKSSKDVVMFDCSCYFGHNLYDIAALDCWIKLPQSFIEKYNSTIIHSQSTIDLSNPIIQLYKAFIYLSGYFHEHNQVLLNKTIKICKKILSRLPKIYPSLSPNLGNVDILLVQCGSFNPIQRNHIRNLILAMKSMKLDQSKSVKCILVPAPDSRIKQKVGPGLGFSTRIKLITQMLTKASIESIGLDLSQLFESDLIQHLRNANPTAEIVMVCGSDTYSYNRRFIPANIRFIVVQRNEHELSLDAMKNGDTLIDNDDETTMSSTFIRLNPTDPIIDQMISC